MAHAHMCTTTQRAVECYRRAATAGQGGEGHPDSWYNLGTIYYEGGPGDYVVGWSIGQLLD